MESLGRIAERARNFPSARTQRIFLAAAVPLFFGAGIWAYMTADVGWRDLQILPLLGALFVGVPLTALVNGWEFETSGAMVGQDLSLGSALRVTVVATALNYLPGHGGPAFRVQSLRSTGPGYRRSSAATLVLGLAWIGIAGLLSGALLFGFSPGSAAWIAGLGGVGAMGLAGIVLAIEHRSLRARLRWGTRIAAVEATSIAVTALRLYLVMYAVGVSASVTGAVVLTLAVVLGSVTGLTPGGLGIRELLAGLFAPLVGLTPALGVLVIGTDRILGLLGHGPLAVYLLRSGVSLRDDGVPG